MASKVLDPSKPGHDADWVGNNAAFICPECAQVFIVSGQLHKQGRECPACGQSKGYVEGGRIKGGVARLEWTKSN